MKHSKFISVLAVAAAIASACISCAKDKGTNPEFGPGEVYIYTNLPSSISATVGEPMNFTMMVSPNDGSVYCKWLLDGVVISDFKDFEYTFYDPGVYKLRFEAERDGFVNYREYTLTVSE